MNWKDYENDRIIFEKQLKTEFPNLYKGLGVHWRDGGMIEGIHIAPGWYSIIYQLSAKLESIISQMENKSQAVQIKEKFGTLRYYVDFETDEISKLINEAEKESYNTCEWCGKQPATLSDYSFWMKTLCDECHEKRKTK